jgi:hypothetical protein
MTFTGSAAPIWILARVKSAAAFGGRPHAAKRTHQEEEQLPGAFVLLRLEALCWEHFPGRRALPAQRVRWQFAAQWVAAIRSGSRFATLGDPRPVTASHPGEAV